MASENSPPASCASLAARLLTVLLQAEGVLVVRLVVGGCAAPKLLVTPPVRRAGVVGFAHEHEGEHAGLAVRVAPVHLRVTLCGAETHRQKKKNHVGLQTTL